jgi:CP family cyanate transporter-like MFS transporter
LPTRPAAVILVAWFAAFNLRSGFIGLGPALPALTLDLGLSFAQASFLVAVPTLMMGLMAVPGGGLADRWGPARVIALGLALVAMGGGMRAAAEGFPLLLVWTFLFGAGVGLSQPGLPRLMRAWFPRRIGATTGLYASGMIAGSVLASSLTGPLLERLGTADAWRVPLALWGIIGAAGLLAWMTVLRPWRASTPAATRRERLRPDDEVAVWSPWRDRRTWIAALFFAAQGIIYYLLVAWLPAIYDEAGADSATVTALFVVFNVGTVPAILLFPTWSDRLGRRRPPSIAAALCVFTGVVGLLALPLAEPWRWLWPALAGAGVSGLFAMSLVLPADVAPRGRTGAAAGMVLGIGYVGSALGPVLAGTVRDVTGSFAATMAMLPALAVATIVLGAIVPELAPGRDRDATSGMDDVSS